jgi:hypothetical protein
MIQSGDGALAHNQVIQRGMRGERRTVADERTGQHRAAVDDVVTLLNRFQRCIEAGEWDFGEEPQRAQVDAEDERSEAGNGARRGKQRAVSAQHQCQIRSKLAEIAAGHDFRPGMIGGAFVIHDDLVVVRLQPFFERWQNFRQLGTVGFGDDADRLWLR